MGADLANVDKSENRSNGLGMDAEKKTGITGNLGGRPVEVVIDKGGIEDQPKSGLSDDLSTIWDKEKLIRTLPSMAVGVMGAVALVEMVAFAIIGYGFLALVSGVIATALFYSASKVKDYFESEHQLKLTQELKETLEVAQDGLKTEVGKLGDKVSDLDTQLTDSKTLADTLGTELKVATDLKNDLQAIVDGSDYLKMQKELQGDCATLREQIAAAKTEQDAIASRNEAATKKNEELTDKIAGLEKTLTDKTAELSKVTGDLTGVAGRILAATGAFEQFNELDGDARAEVVNVMIELIEAFASLGKDGYSQLLASVTALINEKTGQGGNPTQASSCATQNSHLASNLGDQNPPHVNA